MQPTPVKMGSRCDQTHLITFSEYTGSVVCRGKKADRIDLCPGLVL